MASSRMPRLMAWVASVWRSRCGCTPGTPAARPTPAHDAADDVPVQRAAVVGDQPLAAGGCARGWPRSRRRAALTSSGCSGTYRSLRSLPSGMRSQCPAPIWHDRVGLQAGQLAGPHAGAGQQLDDEPVAGVGAGPGGGHQPGRVAVVEELGQRLGLFRDVPGDDRVAGRRVGPVPLDDPLEERPDGADPLPVRLGRDRPAAGPGPGGQPHLVVLDVIAAHRGDGLQPGVGDHPPGELAQRVLCSVHAARGEERGQPLQIPLDRRRHLRRRGPDLRPLRGGDAAGHRPAGGRPAGGQRAHRTAASCTASISATAAASASISSAARRYSPASQSLARCR